MTGMWVRIRRGGKLENVEIEHLGDDELKLFFSSQPETAVRWAVALARWIREHVSETP